MKHFSVIFIEFIASLILLNNHVCIGSDVFQLEYHVSEYKYIPVNEQGTLKVIAFNDKRMSFDPKYIRVNYYKKTVAKTKKIKKKDYESIFTVFRANEIDGRYVLGNSCKFTPIKDFPLANEPATGEEFHFLCRESDSAMPVYTMSYNELHVDQVPQNCLWSAIKNADKEITKFTPLSVFSLKYTKEWPLVEHLDVPGYTQSILVDCHIFAKSIFKSRSDSYMPWTIRYLNAISKQKRLAFYLTKYLQEINFEYKYNHYEGCDHDDQRRGVWRSRKISADKCESDEECLYKITNANDWQYWKYSKLKYFESENTMLLCSTKYEEYFIKKFVSDEQAREDCCLWDKSLTNEGKYLRISECNKN